jgi:hypothetical protein
MHAIDDARTAATTVVRSVMSARSPSLIPQTQSPLEAATVDGQEYSPASRAPSPPEGVADHCAMM